MKNSDWREEYVMNDTGRIWVGSKWRNFGRPWNFGQVYLKKKKKIEN